jgi:hypothetical protein
LPLDRLSRPLHSRHFLSSAGAGHSSDVGYVASSPSEPDYRLGPPVGLRPSPAGSGQPRSGPLRSSAEHPLPRAALATCGPSAGRSAHWSRPPRGAGPGNGTKPGSDAQDTRQSPGRSPWPIGRPGASSHSRGGACAQRRPSRR